MKRPHTPANQLGTDFLLPCSCHEAATPAIGRVLYVASTPYGARQYFSDLILKA